MFWLGHIGATSARGVALQVSGFLNDPPAFQSFANKKIVEFVHCSLARSHLWNRCRIDRIQRRQPALKHKHGEAQREG